MTLTVLYFAAVRDLVGQDIEQLDLPEHVKTIGELSRHLVARHGALAGRLNAVRFARNEEFASLSQAVAAGDVIALIPPVAGG